jgi:hypothetical protein
MEIQVMSFIWKIPQSKVWRFITGGSENLQKQENKKMNLIHLIKYCLSVIFMKAHWVFLFAPSFAIIPIIEGNIYFINFGF